MPLGSALTLFNGHKLHEYCTVNLPISPRVFFRADMSGNDYYYSYNCTDVDTLMESDDPNENGNLYNNIHDVDMADVAPYDMFIDSDLLQNPNLFQWSSLMSESLMGT